MIDDLKNIHKHEIVVRGSGGSHVSRSISDAAQLAIRQNVPVRLIFNDRHYVIDPDKMLAPIYEQHPDDE